MLYQTCIEGLYSLQFCGCGLLFIPRSSCNADGRRYCVWKGKLTWFSLLEKST